MYSNIIPSDYSKTSETTPCTVPLWRKQFCVQCRLDTTVPYDYKTDYDWFPLFLMTMYNYQQYSTSNFKWTVGQHEKMTQGSLYEMFTGAQCQKFKKKETALETKRNDEYSGQTIKSIGKLAPIVTQATNWMCRALRLYVINTAADIKWCKAEDKSPKKQ